MFDPASLTLGQVSSALRDFAIVGFLVGGAWKARGVFDAGKKFFDRLTTFMDTVEDDSAYIRQGMHTLLSNHLTHIETDLRNIAHRQVRATSAEQDAYTTEDSDTSEI
jgi:hypothetical protein